MELIDRKALMQDMGSAEGCGISCDDCAEPNCLTRSVIKRQPTVVADPVRHGWWEKCDLKKLEHGFVESIPGGGICCSECRRGFSKQYMWWDYCPNCGAKMDGGGSDAGNYSKQKEINLELVEENEDLKKSKRQTQTPAEIGGGGYENCKRRLL